MLASRRYRQKQAGGGGGGCGGGCDGGAPGLTEWPGGDCDGPAPYAGDGAIPYTQAEDGEAWRRRYVGVGAVP